MSQSCPLCGKTKSEKNLFCEECTRRIRRDYEVNLPASSQTEPLPGEKSAEPNNSRDGVYSRDTKHIVDIDHTRVVKKTSIEDTRRLDHRTSLDDRISIDTKKKSRFRAPFLFLLVILLLGGGFFVYNETVRKRNIERSGWQAAQQSNSVEGYMEYMLTFPQGAHFDEAQEGLFRLKSEEAKAWDRLKSTDNTAELRDFLALHPDAPYAPLVERRLDSLSWAGARRVNTREAYTEYLSQSERGLLRGDYVFEARQRYDELVSTPSEDSLFIR